jgi:hypothetical protein
MASAQTPVSVLLNRYRAMMRSFEIATGKYNEIIRIHGEIEAADVRRQPQQFSHMTQELNVEPKLQWYIDNYGKTTPGGKKIDVKTIAERNKISTQKAYAVLKTHYGVMAEMETAKAIQYEAAEKNSRRNQNCRRHGQYSPFLRRGRTGSSRCFQGGANHSNNSQDVSGGNPGIQDSGLYIENPREKYRSGGYKRRVQHR